MHIAMSTASVDDTDQNQLGNISVWHFYIYFHILLWMFTIKTGMHLGSPDRKQESQTQDKVSLDVGSMKWGWILVAVMKQCSRPSHLRMLPCWESWASCLHLGSSLSEKAMAPHSSTLAWKIPWMEEPGRLQSMGLLRVRHDWATSLFTFMHWRRKWQPTPVFLPRESQGPWSLVVFRLWGRTELDMTETT